MTAINPKLYIARFESMPVIRITDETFDLLCQLRKKVPADTPAELVEWLTEKGTDDIGIIINADKEEGSEPLGDNPNTSCNEQLRHNGGNEISSSPSDNTCQDGLSEDSFAPIYGETIAVAPNQRSRRSREFTSFNASQLVNVKPIRALVKGRWFKISYWNRAVFAAIKALVDEGVAIEEIVRVLYPLIKIGNPKGSVPIKGQNISHMFINTPKISWQCVEKLHDGWGIDIRVRFRWNKKAPEELRGRSYEIRTGYPNLVAL